MTRKPSRCVNCPEDTCRLCPHVDDMAPARGFVNGILMAGPFWAVVAAIAWVLW